MLTFGEHEGYPQGLVQAFRPGAGSRSGPQVPQVESCQSASVCLWIFILSGFECARLSIGWWSLWSWFHMGVVDPGRYSINLHSRGVGWSATPGTVPSNAVLESGLSAARRRPRLQPGNYGMFPGSLVRRHGPTGSTLLSVPPEVLLTWATKTGSVCEPVTLGTPNCGKISSRIFFPPPLLFLFLLEEPLLTGSARMYDSLNQPREFRDVNFGVSHGGHKFLDS